MKTCPHCGDTMTNPRRVQCGKDECKRLWQNERLRRFYAEHKEKTGTPYTARYVEKRRANDRARNATLPHWRHRYPEAFHAAEQRRGRRVAAAMVGAEKFDPGVIFERDRWKCGLCLAPIDPALQYPHPMSKSIDHVIPLSKGGPHTKENVRASHLFCNLSRGARGGNEQLLLIG